VLRRFAVLFASVAGGATVVEVNKVTAGTGSSSNFERYASAHGMERRSDPGFDNAHWISDPVWQHQSGRALKEAEVSPAPASIRVFSAGATECQI
jgi:hypothetical protein